MRTKHSAPNQIIRIISDWILGLNYPLISLDGEIKSGRLNVPPPGGSVSDVKSVCAPVALQGPGVRAQAHGNCRKKPSRILLPGTELGENSKIFFASEITLDKTCTVMCGLLSPNSSHAKFTLLSYFCSQSPPGMHVECSLTVLTVGSIYVTRSLKLANLSME